MIGTSSAEAALDDPGTVQTAIGWGLTSEDGTSIPADQRYVEVRVDTDSACSRAYPPGRVDAGGNPLEYHRATMLCAGPLSGGQDACAGDSGGPLAIQASDRSWRQTGVVSFGDGCARPDNPGVYSRLTVASSWIEDTRRFGPFDADAGYYIVQQYRDFENRLPTSQELIYWAEALKSAPPSEIVVNLQARAAFQGNHPVIARLYRAAFLRVPDRGGFTYWTNQRWAGRSPVSIANDFIAAPEFKNRYGTLSNHDFVTLMYRNMFQREPDAAARKSWEDKLAYGLSRGQMLYELSNSCEYRRNTDTDVRIITTWFAMLAQVPSAGELATSRSLSQRQLADLLRLSFRYAWRFNG